MPKTETIRFRYGTKHKKKLIVFTIEHNLYEHGLTLEAAFDNWAIHCDDPTDLPAFIEYLLTLNPNIIANAKQ